MFKSYFIYAFIAPKKPNPKTQGKYVCPAGIYPDSLSIARIRPEYPPAYNSMLVRYHILRLLQFALNSLITKWSLWSMTRLTSQ